MFTELLKPLVKPRSRRAKSLGALAALPGFSECMARLSRKKFCELPRRAPRFPWSTIRWARPPTLVILPARFVTWSSKMRVGWSTSPTRASVPGSISPARFSRNLAATPFRFFPFRPTRPLDPLADRTIPYCLRQACTHSEFALVPGKKHCVVFLKKKPHRSRRRKTYSALARTRFFEASE